MKKLTEIIVNTVLLLLILSSCSQHHEIVIIDGIDVSHHQENIDWERVAKSGRVGFVFAKATEGATWSDSRCRSYVANAKKEGLHAGAYHLLKTSSSVVDQFNNFKSHFPADADLFPMVDIEDRDFMKVDSKTLQNMLQEFNELCEKEYGTKPILYMSAGVYNDKLSENSSRFKNNILFISAIGKSIPRLRDGRKSFIWQHSLAPIPGIRGNVDNDRLVGLDISDILLQEVIKKPQNGEYQGIDVSHYQSEKKIAGKWKDYGKIDWSKVAHDKNIQFVYIKATQGRTITDKYFSYNLSEAKKHGFKVGAYHFYSTESKVEDQFRHFIKVCPKENVDLIPMIDVEPGKNPSAKKRSKVQKEVRELAKLIEAYYGTKPMIYATMRSYNEYLAPIFNKDYLLYIARYQSGSNPPIINGPDHYDIWQYSETGQIDGIPLPVDLCRFHPDTNLKDISL